MKNIQTTRVIPRELIKHLEWNPEQDSQQPPKEPPRAPTGNHKLSIDSILKGTPFYDAKMPIALRKAEVYAGSSGIVVNLLEFIAAKAKADKSHPFWNDWYTVQTEEDIGIDKTGKFYTRRTPILVVMHGGGILIPERIEAAYTIGLLDGSAKFQENEFEDLLKGNIYGKSFPLYRIEEVKKGISNLPHQFGVVMPYEMAQRTTSGFHQKDPFLKNPLVLARAASSLDHLENYYEKAKALDNDLGNWHPFENRDASVPQGRVLFVDDAGGGLSGISYLNSGRFVGVAPEAQGAKKRSP